ncbi:GspH/FimT family pseudopilin [Vibrio bivalvicida]|uniref:Type II secretion system protein H n=1 Tax=Vibrio bivalvicida TaxID=1276888 RepID=A0ABV4MF76_9VIBR
MSRGFTLLELLISIIVLGVLLSVAAPSFHTLSVNSQMMRAANELNGFLNQARSEAVWRNRDLWAHFSFSSYPALAKEWALTLTDSDTLGLGNKILLLQGSSFKDLKLDWTYTANKIKFEGTRGRVKDGSLTFYPKDQVSLALRLKSSFAGNRVMICALSESDYGFPVCE